MTRAFCCTHLKSLLPSQIRKSGLPRLTRASAHPPIILLRLWQQCARDERVKGAAHSSQTFSFEILVFTQTSQKAARQRNIIVSRRLNARCRRTLSRRATKILVALPKILLRKILLDIASLRALSVARVATSHQRAQATRSLRANVSAVAVWAIWMDRNCPTRNAQAGAPENAASSSNAVASAGRGAAQVFTVAVIGGVRIADALDDTGSAFSMLSTAM